MKKNRQWILLALGVLLLSVTVKLGAQQVLPGYNGYWLRGLGNYDIRAFLFHDAALIRRLRNEIFARYGRSFLSADLQEYFGQQSWYRVRPDYLDSWVSQREQQIARDLLNLEQGDLSPEEYWQVLARRSHFEGADASFTVLGRDTLLLETKAQESPDSGFAGSPYGQNYGKPYGPAYGSPYGAYSGSPYGDVRSNNTYSWHVRGNWIIAERPRDSSGTRIQRYLFRVNPETGEILDFR